jgi:hypothetical protein
MTPESEEEQEDTEMAGGSRLGGPLFIAAAFAAGAGAALGTKAFLDSRRKGSHDGEPRDGEPDQDLPTVLRRAGLDVAIAATNQAAERLTQDQSEPQNGESALHRS